MSNPTRWMRRTIGRITCGVCEAGQRLERATASRREAMASISKKDHSLAIEILAIWIRQLISRAIDLGFGWLVQKVIEATEGGEDDSIPDTPPRPLITPPAALPK